MATFTGFIPKRAFAGIRGIRSKNLDSLDTNQELRHTWVASSIEANTRTSNLPLETTHREGLTGPRMDYLYETIYNRVHIRPKLLALGNIVGVQQRDVLVWNANFTPVTLKSISKENAEGIELTGQQQPPLAFGALSERSYSAQITSDGPAVVDASYLFEFSNSESLNLRITGSRLVVFSFYPTWEGGITETLEWLTDVISSPLGDEQRRSLRLAPRRSFEISVVAEGRERQRMDLVTLNWGASIWAIPVWNDVQELRTAPRSGNLRILCQTFGRDFRAGGLMLLRGADEIDYEVVEIASVEGDGVTLSRPVMRNWPIYTIVYPLRTARFSEQPSLTRLTEGASSSSFKFLVMENSDWQVWAPTEMHQGFPVFRLPPEESENLANSYIRLLKTLDSRTNLPGFVDTANLGFTVQAYRWLLSGRAEQNAFRQLLYYLRGQWKSVWLPTHSQDMTMVTDYSKTGQTIDVEHIEYTKYGVNRPGRKDLLITLIDGTTFARRITGSTELSSTIERITLDTGLGVDIPVKRVARISYMALSRLGSDSVEIDHQTDSDGVSAARVTWRSLRDDIA